MANYDGEVGQAGLTADLTNRAYALGLSPNATARPPVWTSFSPHGYDIIKVLDVVDRTGPFSEGSPSPASTSYDGEIPRSPGDDFFDRIIILPRRFDLGIVLSTETDSLELYNAYRDTDRTLTAFTNNVDAGVSITDLPGLPYVLPDQSGLALTLQTTTDGPPTIDGTLDFTTDLIIVYLPMTGQRTIVWPFLPEQGGYVERLRWRTNVITRRKGTDQLIALRDTPQQLFKVRYALDDHPRRKFDAVLLDVQGRAVGLPIWHEPSIASAAVSITDTTVEVDSTAYADWRVGSLGLTWVDEDDFEALEVASYDGTSITWANPYTRAFPVGALVLPIRVAYATQVVRGSRRPVALQYADMTFMVQDDDVDLSDVSAFESLNSKVLLDEPNLLTGNSSESYDRPVILVDPGEGTFSLYTEWDLSRRGSAKGFLCGSRQRLWEVRQLLHALRGRSTSFYLPTFWPDLEPIAALSSGSDILTIRNVGYNKHLQDRQPRDRIAVRLTDGTRLLRQITASTEIDEDEERLTVDSNWGVDASLDEIRQVEYVEEVRLDSDDVEIRHIGPNGRARVFAPVKATLE